MTQNKKWVCPLHSVNQKHRFLVWKARFGQENSEWKIMKVWIWKWIPLFQLCNHPLLHVSPEMRPTVLFWRVTTWCTDHGWHNAVKDYWAGLAVQVTWECTSREAGSCKHPCLGNCALCAHSHLLLEVFYHWAATVFTTFKAVYCSVSSNSSCKVIFNLLTKKPKVSQTWFFCGISFAPLTKHNHCLTFPTNSVTK